jgi:hypothetical protein
MKLRIAIALMVAGLGRAIICDGQTISLLDVKVTDLQPFYVAGQPIVLTPVKTPKNSLHVRVFFGSVEQLKRTRPDPDNCIPFYTTILWGVGHPGVIKLDPINTGDLLSHVPAERRNSATVTLVFEAGFHPEWGAFRLKPESVEDYFRYAIEIHVNPSATPRNIENQIVKAVVNGVQNSNPVVTPVASSTEASFPEKLPCYDVNPHPLDKAADEAEDAGELLVATVTQTGCAELPLAKPAPLKTSGF